MDKGGLFFLQDITDCQVHLRRSRHIGIAQTEIIHILRTVDGSQTLTLLKHGPDGGIIIDQWFHFLRYHTYVLSFSLMADLTLFYINWMVHLLI